MGSMQYLMPASQYSMLPAPANYKNSCFPGGNDDSVIPSYETPDAIVYLIFIKCFSYLRSLYPDELPSELCLNKK